MILRMAGADGNTDDRHAGMDCRHPSGLQDASGDIYVGLGSSTPCRNDATKRFLLELTVPLNTLFSRDRELHEER